MSVSTPQDSLLSDPTPRSVWQFLAMSPSDYEQDDVIRCRDGMIPNDDTMAVSRGATFWQGKF